MGKVMSEGYKCERCGHTWVSSAKIKETPTICPKCKSPYWNKLRKVDSTEDA
jgi:predicted Zn-ribbon and HTH transcriptional regulator